MTISELIELLGNFPGKTPVLLAEDPEGNAFSQVLTFGYGYVNNRDLGMGRLSDCEVLDDADYEDDPDLDQNDYSEVFILWP